MQQQTNSTSNLQIKLITDARKLLEKVRSQQLLSADSSFDSSFLFETMQDSKEVGMGLGGGGTTIKKDSSGEDNKKHIHPPLEFNIEGFGGSSTSSSFNVNGRKDISVSPQTSSKKSEPLVSTNANTNANTNDDYDDMDGDAFLLLPLPAIPQSIGDGKLASVAEDEIINHQIMSDSPRHDSDNGRNVMKLHEENMKLKQENYQLNEEMNDFEYKLYCLEHTLGIIEDVEKSHKDYDIGQQQNTNNKRSIDVPKTNNTDLNNDFLPLASSSHEAKDRLSPITALVADAVLSGTGMNNENANIFSSAGRDGPPSSPNPISSTHVDEIKVLRENNEKMVTAIKALAQATISQTRKHYLYKKRHHMTKQMVVEESEKLNQLMVEKDKVQSEYYETRSKFLKEKDMREELSNEIQHIAKKNNLLRKEKQMHEDMRVKILDRVEFRDDTASVLSRISDSSCFPILQTITESGQAPKVRRNNKLSKDKNVEKLIFKLISQLKKRDAKIQKLEKKLKITMQYLQGALELEVARQDAEATLSQKTTR